MEEAAESCNTEVKKVSLPGFRHRTVQSLSISVIVLGILSFGVGIATLVIALPSICTFEKEPYYYHRYQATSPPPTYYEGPCLYHRTYSSPGLWGGAMFVASGIIGLLSAKRKTICFIAAMMVMSIVAAWTAICSMALSVSAHFDGGYLMQTIYPTSLHVLDSVITVFSLACFVLSWIKFGYACQAICCNGKRKYPAMKQRHQGYQYQQLGPNPIMYDNQQMPSYSGLPVQGFQPVPVIPGQNSTEPIYLVQGHKVIGMLPQNAKPAVANSSSSDTTQVIQMSN